MGRHTVDELIIVAINDFVVDDELIWLFVGQLQELNRTDQLDRAVCCPTIILCICGSVKVTTFQYRMSWLEIRQRPRPSCRRSG